MEDWVTIKQLKAKNPDMSLREIGKLIGVDHHTVKKALERENPPEYQMESRINPRLKPFEEVIFEMANVKGFRGSWIYEEICSKESKPKSSLDHKDYSGSIDKARPGGIFTASG